MSYHWNKDLFENWLSTGQITIELSEERISELDDLVQTQLQDIEDLIDNNMAEKAFANLALLTSFINAAASKRPSILNKLKKWVKKFKNLTNRLAKKLGADGFSIGVSVPLGLTIELSFPIT